MTAALLTALLTSAVRYTARIEVGAMVHACMNRVNNEKMHVHARPVPPAQRMGLRRGQHYCAAMFEMQAGTAANTGRLYQVGGEGVAHE